MLKTHFINMLKKLKSDGVILSDSYAVAYSKHVARSNNRPNANKNRLRGFCAKTLIPLGDNHAAKIKRWAMDLYPRRKNWTTPSSSYYSNSVHDNNLGRYSSRCTYTHYTYTPKMQSYGFAYKSKLYAKIDGMVYKLKAPRGYYFALDNNGLKIVANSNVENDYHFTSNDVLLGVKHMIKCLKENVEKRKALKIKANKQVQINNIVSTLDDDKILVCIKDSLRAGNCLDGTKAFIERHNINARHVSVKLLKKIEDNKYRVDNVIKFAKIRTANELLAGVCYINDHY